MLKTQSEISDRASFSQIRYAQCWEDADILLAALDIQPGDTCLSIASAGDNTLAMLARSPQKVIALDLNPAQLACLELRVAAYRELTHPELLILIGSDGNPQHRGLRTSLYRRCRADLSPEVRQFWDSRPQDILQGIGHAGKFEQYFQIFRRYVLPGVHGRDRILHLLQDKSLEARQHYYQTVWNTPQWRWMFRLFFSRFVMGNLGRHPSFFNYVEGSVAEQILSRTTHALTTLNPALNPYLQWILTGQHLTALPYHLRPENFEAIRSHLSALEWHCGSVESFLDQMGDNTIDRYNLSDIFEYMSIENYQQLLQRLVQAARPGGRIAYWNMLAPRRCPEKMYSTVRSLTELAQSLHQQDQAFFYSAFNIEEAIGVRNCVLDSRSSSYSC
ncbi:DUF3419 family protein [Oscillatoria laete-virens NRMC-F 0139]|nr:DUF3419 family protein [Oscillatoria laete-virens]MDI9640057.1 DUF3419 family protein [Geitlerinema splendidum]MDL5055809.1 DUF3419 family protein [Oscillatoria laete-virens NRMC-F 0139]